VGGLPDEIDREVKKEVKNEELFIAFGILRYGQTLIQERGI
jgi:hypothetical protein